MKMKLDMYSLRNTVNKRLHRHIITPARENPVTFIFIMLVVASIICLVFLLLGGVLFRGIYLAKFEFAEPIRLLTGKSEISFSLYGNCVDDVCTNPTFLNRFDQMPNSSDIQPQQNTNTKRGFPSIPAVSSAGQAIGQAASSAGASATSAASSAGQAVGQAASAAGATATSAASSAGQAVGQAASAAGATATAAASSAGQAINSAGQTIVSDGQDALNATEKLAAEAAAKVMLAALDSFVPKHSVANLAGLFSIPYLLALKFQLVTLALFYFDFLFIATITSFFATALIFIAWLLDEILFVWVFDLVGLVPGIGSEVTGPGMRLATAAFVMGLISTGMLISRIFVCCAWRVKRKVGSLAHEKERVVTVGVDEIEVPMVEHPNPEKPVEGFEDVQV